jgi:hypothetical protein
VLGQRSQANTVLALSDEVTWKKPRNILIVAAWSITSASIMLNVFLNGGQTLEWYVLLLLFFMSIFGGMLLQEIKAIVLGVFEAIFLTVLLTYIGMIFPILIGRVTDFYEIQQIYTSSFQYAFKIFFPMVPIIMAIGAIVGGFAEDWLF